MFDRARTGLGVFCCVMLGCLGAQRAWSKDARVLRVASGTGFVAQLKGERELFYAYILVPEPEALFGQEALRANQEILRPESKVRVERVPDANGTESDEALAFVRGERGELLLNEELVRRGLASVAPSLPLGPLQDRLLKAQAEAQSSPGRGIWGTHQIIEEAWALLEKGRNAEAGQDIESALKRVEKNGAPWPGLPWMLKHWAEVHLLRAAVLARQGSEDARREIARVYERGQEDAAVRVLLARYLGRMGLLQDACAQLKASDSMLGPETPPYLLMNAAETAYELKDWSRAAATYRRISERMDLSQTSADRWKEAQRLSDQMAALLQESKARLEAKDILQASRTLKDARDLSPGSDRVAELEAKIVSDVTDQVASLMDQGRISQVRLLVSLPLDSIQSSELLQRKSREVNRALADWEATKAINTEEAYEAYLSRNPPSELVEEASALLNALRTGDRISGPGIEAQAQSLAVPEERRPDRAETSDVWGDEDLRQVAAMSRPGVLFLKITPKEEESASGSAFVISEKGYALTAAHCVRDPETGEPYEMLQIERPAPPDKTSDSKYKPIFDAAHVTKIHKDVDLAVIRIPFREGMRVLPLGDSDAVKLLEPVMAIGHPLGLEYTVTVGRVNNILGKEARDHTGRKRIFKIIQTDVTVNPGNSGCPLINSSGEVIGVCSGSIKDTEGLHFFVPINEAVDILPGDLR